MKEQAVDDVQAILVFDAQAIDKADTVLDSHAVFNAQAVPDSNAVLNAQAIDDADGVDPVEAVVNHHRVTHRDVIGARGTAVGITACGQNRGKRKAHQHFQDF